MSDHQQHVSESTFLRILYEFSASLIQIQDIDELLWHVARKVVGQLGFEDCVIYLLDEDADSLVQMAAIGDKNPTAYEIHNRLVIPVGKGVTGRVARDGKPILLDDTSNESDYIHDTVDGISELCVPINKVYDKMSDCPDGSDETRRAMILVGNRLFPEGKIIYVFFE